MLFQKGQRVSRGWISPERTSSRQASEVDFFGSGFRRALILLIASMSICLLANADTTSSISGNFNGTAIAGGNYIWFTSVLKPSGLGSTPVTIYVRKSTISFTANGANYTIPVPDANIVFNPNATTATTTFNSATNQWDTTVPSSGLAGNTLLDAVEYLVPAGGLPGGIKNVTWQINFSTDTSGISLNWQWAAGVYPTFSTTYNSLGVKPVDDTKASQYQNSDHAGTPENYKSYVVGGATGGGASNYTGSLSATVGLAVPLVQAPTASAGGPYSGFIAQTISFNGGGSSDPNGDALTYSWGFGDGGTATGATPTHTYTAAGTFTVTLSVTDGRNATGTATSTATITAPPPPTVTATQNPPPNAAGWNKTSVTVTFTCNDSVSGIKSCSAPATVTAQGANQSVTGTAVNNAGESTPVTVKVSIDETPPTITATPSPAPNAGWNNTNVTVNFACGDTLSGIAQCPSPVVVSASGPNQVVSGTATDKAGNSATATLTLNVELTLPSIVAVASPGPNANGWNNANVTVSFTCTPSSSPITSCPSPQVVSTEGANQVISGMETDAAGNTNTAKVTLNIGKTPPTIVPVISPPPNASGWNNSAVKVNFTCTAGTAPLATCPAPQTISTEGANQSITGTATDVAGNSTTVQVPLNIAITPPTITTAVSPAANVNGWNNSNVTVTFTCTAAKAPIASCPPPQTVSTQGANQTISGTVTDVAGNTATAHVDVSLATTPPTITASVFPLPDAQGWNNSPVTVSFVCTNTVAPIASCPGTQVISAGGANQSVTGTATDVAGNTASASVTLNIGIAPPTMGGVISPAPNAAGWNNSNVTVTWTCVPGTAPIAVPPSPSVVNTEGANQVVTGVCTDIAGNSVSSSVTVNIDKTPPTIAASASPTPNAAGWNTSAVTVTFTCSDALSGVPACPPPQTVSTPGAGQIVRGTATDLAGNPASTQFTVNISETRPLIIPVIAPPPNAAGWNNTNVTVSFTCTPGGAPIASCPLPQLISTEGASIPVSGTVTDAAGATATASAVIKLDKTPPTVTPNISPAPNSNGWETAPVTVSFTCSDSLSGVATCPSSTLISSDGANQPVSGVATDIAGNTATGSANVNLEQALPTITASVSPAANSAGWNNTAVTVTFTCHQSVSPIASCSPSQTVSTQGVGQVITGTVQDQAGNQSTTSVTLNITETSPTILQFTAPTQLSPGQSGSATLTVSDIASVASVVFQLNGTAIGTVLAPPYTVNVTAPSTATSGSTLTLTAVVTDVAGNASSTNKGIQVVSSGVIVGEVLSDATGLPLAGATLQVVGQAGQGATSDSVGRYSIPVTSNQLFLSISQPGNSGGTPAMLTVERQVSVQSGVGTVPVDARLTALASPTTITGSGGTVGTGTITVTVPAGGATTVFNLTPLSQQGLPGLLPLGWSPVAAFDLRANVSTSAALSANFTGLPTGSLYLVSYSYNVHAWNMVTPNLSASNGSLTVGLPSTGDYALVVPDAGNASIQIPATGQPLTGVTMVALPTTATSSGSLSPANIAPTGGTSMASLAVQSTTPLPSGTVIQSEVTEKYTLASGQLLSEEPRFEDILLYQTPAPSGSTVAASFPVTPSQTFQVSQLSSGDVHMDILSGRESVRGQTGGSDPVAVQSGDATLTIAGGSLPQDTAIAVTPETLDTFLPSTGTLVPISEYSVDFSGQVLNAAAQLSVGLGSAAPGSNVVVAQILRVGGVPYLVVVSTAQVTATNIISQVTPGLPGITQGGDYVFYELTVPTGFVSGTVSASSGPVAATVQTDALPFVAFSNSNGNYIIAAAAGTAHLTASIPNTALAGTATAQVTASQTATVNLNVVGQVESATITPANGALGVPLTAEIDITAAEAFNAATVTSSSVVLTAAGSSAPIALRFVFSGGGAKLAVFPQVALQPSTRYTLQASGVANALGGLISVPTTSFTTVAITAPTYNTNALVFAMPDSNGNVAISAPANSFPAGSTILIVDQTNGVVYSLTVFNDGSVTGQMPATINDLLQITFTDPAGNITSFTRSEFIAADGTVAVGPGGGTVTGPGGTALIIPAGALNQGATFKLALFDQSAIPDMPAVDNLQFGTGLTVQTSGVQQFNSEVKMVFPVPAGAPAGAQYYIYRRTTFSDGSIGYEAIDEALLQGSGASAQVVTASPPFYGYQVVGGAVSNVINGIDTFLCTYIFDPLFPTQFTQGAITGKVLGSSYKPGSSAAVTTGIQGAQVRTQKPGVVDSATRKSVFAVSQADGTYTLWDPNFTGGTITATATNIPANFLPPNAAASYQTTAFEIQNTDSSPFIVLLSGLLGKYVNVAYGDIIVPPPAPPQPPPAFQISVMQVNNGIRTATSGIVTAGASLIVGVNPQPGSGQGVAVIGTTIAVNGQSIAVTTDSQGQFAVTAPYTPGLPGVYTVQVTVANAFGGPPTIASNTFRAIGAGGSGNTTTVGQAPAILTSQSYPTNGATQVPVNVNALIAFSEPVTIPAGSAQLQNGGSLVSSLIGGVDSHGNPYSDITKAPAGTAFTSITIQPLQSLHYSGSANDPQGTYQIVLSAAIKDLNQPPLSLVAGSSPITFYTYQIPLLSNGAAAFASPGIFVAKDRAYVAEISPSSLAYATVWQFNVSDPSTPFAIAPASDGVIEGRADYVTGQDNSSEAGGQTLVAVAVAPYPLAPDQPGQTSHVMLYKGTSSAGNSGNPDSLSWIGAVSLTSGATDGVVSAIAVQDNRLYAATIRKGIQVVDLDQVISEFPGTINAVINYDINTAGQGFANDAVIATIGVQTDPTLEYLDDLLDIKVANYPAAGGQNQTLVVATGSVPSAPGSSTSVSFVVADPNAVTIVSKTTPQSAAGALNRGVALALGPVQTATTVQNIAAVVGYGSATGCASCTVMAVMDMTTPTQPQPLSFTVLSGTPSGVVLNGNTAIVGYSSDASDLFDLTNPAHPQFLGTILYVGGSLFLYNGTLFSTGAVPGVPTSALGGVHSAQLGLSPFTVSKINFTGNCTVLTPPTDPEAGAGCFNVYNDTVNGDTVVGDTIGTAPLSTNPAWQPGVSLPVAYVMGQTINLQVTVTQNPVPLVPSNITITGKGGAGLSNCTWTGQTSLTSTFTFTCTMTTAVATVYNAINWSYTSSGASGFIGQTTNPVYVTLAPPLQYTAAGYAPIVYHTTLNLALSGGQSTDQTTAFQNTWNQFSMPAPTTANPNATGPANITTWQGRRLYYYRNDPNGSTINGTIVGFDACALNESTLLLNEGFDQNGNLVAGHNSGQCGSFAYLLIGALAVNGIESSFAKILPIQNLGLQNINFLVKNWTPPQSNPSGPWNLCFNPTAVHDIMVPAQPGGVYCDLTSLPTLVGQNTQPPSEKIFAAHFIVKPSVSGVPTYVDPSYGVTYSGASNLQSSAIFGYFDFNQPLISNTGTTYYLVTAPDPANPGITITP